MKNSKGLGVIRLGDSTSHGGKVISAAADLKALGKAVALHGDQATCPKCKGTFAIQVHQARESADCRCDPHVCARG